MGHSSIVTLFLIFLVESNIACDTNDHPSRSDRLSRFYVSFRSQPSVSYSIRTHDLCGSLHIVLCR